MNNQFPLLDNLLNISELNLISYDILDEEIILNCETIKNNFCPKCGKESNTFHQNHEKNVRDLSILGKAVFLHFSHKRWECTNCKSTFMERFSFIDETGKYTNRFVEHIHSLCKKTNIKATSELEQINYDAVEGIYYRFVKKKSN